MSVSWNLYWSVLSDICPGLWLLNSRSNDLFVCLKKKTVIIYATQPILLTNATCFNLVCGASNKTLLHYCKNARVSWPTVLISPLRLHHSYVLGQFRTCNVHSCMAGWQAVYNETPVCDIQRTICSKRLTMRYVPATDTVFVTIHAVEKCIVGFDAVP